MNSLVLSGVAYARVAATELQSSRLDPVALYAGIAVAFLAGWAVIDYRRRALNARRFQETAANQFTGRCKPTSACAQFAGRRISAGSPAAYL